jgi:hypothetical protein
LGTIFIPAFKTSCFRTPPSTTYLIIPPPFRLNLSAQNRIPRPMTCRTRIPTPMAKTKTMVTNKFSVNVNSMIPSCLPPPRLPISALDEVFVLRPVFRSVQALGKSALPRGLYAATEACRGYFFFKERFNLLAAILFYSKINVKHYFTEKAP